MDMGGHDECMGLARTTWVRVIVCWDVVGHVGDGMGQGFSYRSWARQRLDKEYKVWRNPWPLEGWHGMVAWTSSQCSVTHLIRI